jgi:serine/threonine protein phosphatase 1
MAKRRFVIGDIHGCNRTFKALLFETCKITKDDKIYLLGDYIDRGPGSKQVINLIINLLIEGYDIKCLMGNHELMLMQSINSNAMLQTWLKNGGKITLESFGVDHPAKLKKKYKRFFTGLRYYIPMKNYILVHGGLNFNISDPLQDTETMVWIRNQDVDTTKIGGRRLIVGHTPTKLAKIKESIAHNKIMLDGGCVYFNMNKEMGNLCAFEIGSKELFIQKCIDFDS